MRQDWFYVFDMPGINQVKIGRSFDVGRRGRTHRTSNPGLVELVRFPCDDAHVEEDDWKKTFATDLVEGATEVFVKSGAVKARIDDLVRCWGASKPPDRRESALLWLRRVARDGKTAAVRSAAARDVATWERMAPDARAESGGGWSLWEWLGAQKGCRPCPPMLTEPAFATFTYRGERFIFHVWQEACERYGIAKKNMPRGALHAGLFPRNHYVKTNRS